MALDRNLDPRHNYELAVRTIDSMYDELERYCAPGKLDLLAHGIDRFLGEIDRLREIGDRVLQMKRNISVLRSYVRSIAMSKRRHFERMVVRDLETFDGKGMTAKDRRQAIELRYFNEEQDADAWTILDKSLQDLVVDLTDKHKQLVDSKQDIRANLMSLRLQLVLERAGTNWADLLKGDGARKTAQWIERQRMIGNQEPGDPGGADDPVLAMDPRELDNLLDGKDGLG